PLDVINLRLPAEWARGASVRPVGGAHQQVSETRKDLTTWAIRPDRPVWGSWSLVIRSSLPFRGGGTRAFPELSPLGRRGGVDTYLRIDNATKRPIAVEGSSGLQAVAASSVPADVDLEDAGAPGATAWNYHVLKDGWSLRIQKPGDAEGPGGAQA